MHAFTGTLAVYLIFTSFLHFSTGTSLVPFIKINTARLDEVSNSSLLGTFDGVSSVKCAVQCSSELDGACQSFLYNMATGRCTIYSSVHDTNPPGTTPEPWAYYTAQSYYTTQSETYCRSLYAAGHTNDGVYTITIEGGVSATTWCDMTNGGWTVFQRRQDGSEDFYRPWSDYVAGFGDPAGEFWLGLEKIHLLTKMPSQLYIYLETWNDVTPATAYATYTIFYVGDASTNYTLTIGGYSGDCGDSMRLHNGYMFTTIDADNDEKIDENCAVIRKGAWWYKHCLDANLNAVYHQGNHTTPANHVNWASCWGKFYSLRATVMKVRRMV